MSYEVNSRKEIRQRLEELGVDSVEDIRRAHGSRRRDVPAVVEAERLALQAHGSPESMSVVVDELARVAGRVGAVRDEIRDLLDDVRGLGGRQSDGWGPIAERMAACVTDRAGVERGAEQAVAGYLAELADLDAVLTGAALLYAGAEQESLADLGKAARGDA